MSYYGRSILGECCDDGAFGYDGYRHPYESYGYGDYGGYGGGCLCHCCRIRTRCKWWRRRFK